jgi:hypothetical protein
MSSAPRTSSVILMVLVGAGAPLLAASCVAPKSDQPDSGGQTARGTGGVTVSGSGGTTGAGASTGSGGTTGAGGSIGSGGSGTGGVLGTGGVSGPAAGTGGRGTGGTLGTGGLTGAGGRATGGATGTAGATGTGGKGTGGVSGTGGTTGTGGKGTGGTTGAGGSSGKVYGQCRFHFGTTDGIAKNNPSLIQQLDFFTPGWMGSVSDTFDMQYVCDYTKAGGTFANQVPAVVAYLAAFYVKRHHNLKDCNAPGSQQDLCQVGAGFISQDLANIVAAYESFATGFAGCYGTTRPIIFMMEPDFYQYTISNQSQPWTGPQAGQIMSQLVGAIKKHLPNAVFSMDISPWVAPNDGQDNGQQWYANFDMTQFTFINTSGGSTSASTAKIRGDMMTWGGVNQVTGKPIMADTGYGVNGSSAGPDPAWDSAANINARIADGVVSISQYNPASTWGTTISAVRSQLVTPRYCP